MTKNTQTLLVGLVIGLLIGAGAMFVATPFLGLGGGTTTFTITSSGSTTVLPLSQEWASQITTYYPTFQFNPTGGGSGKGQSDSAGALVDIGATSSYPKEEWRTANPDMHILPISADGLGVVINPEVNDTMKMDCDMAVAIFSGQIDTWEDFETTFGVEVEATGDISVYVRSDASGTTATFGKWLETADDNTNSEGEEYTWEYGHDEALDWPAGLNAVEGNPGVASGVKNDDNGVGYVGLAFMDDLVPVDLYNPGNDEWVSPSEANVLKSLPDEITDPGVNLFNSENTGAYPIARLLFYLINPDNLQWYTIAFLDWCLSTGQEYIADVGYVPIVGSSAHVYAVSVVAGMTPTA